VISASHKDAGHFTGTTQHNHSAWPSLCGSAKLVSGFVSVATWDVHCLRQHSGWEFTSWPVECKSSTQTTTL